MTQGHEDSGTALDAAVHEHNQLRILVQAADLGRDIGEPPGAAGYPEHVKTLAAGATFHEFYAKSQRLVKLIHDAGVPLLTGTDGPGGNLGQSLQSEFRERAAAGIPTLDILRATTINPAAFVGRSNQMGRVGEGMQADFLLLGTDPLLHVDNLADIAAVIRDGHFIPREEIASVVETLRSEL